MLWWLGILDYLIPLSYNLCRATKPVVEGQIVPGGSSPENEGPFPQWRFGHREPAGALAENLTFGVVFARD